MNTYEALSAGKPVVWSQLDEQGRYEAWSFYYTRVLGPFGYVAFCNHMDTKTSAEQNLAPRAIMDGLARGVSTFGQPLRG